MAPVDPGPTRRDALKRAAAAAAVAGCKSPASGGADDTGVVPGQIDHVIVVMFENRSFDHWLGARTLLEGRTEEDGLSAEMSNLGADGSPIAPFPSAVPCLSDPPHSWNATHSQINDGAMDGFATQYAARVGGNGEGVMAYQQREDLPITWALADAGTVCSRWFCSVAGPTWPNRLYGHMASSQGQTTNDLPDDQPAFTERTVWKALEEIGIDWHYYYGDLPFIGLFADHWDDSKIGPMDDFFRDCERGDLAPVIWIDPAFSYNDNHPPHHPGLGELLLGSIYEALATSPAWERCLLIVLYDEHGGFFDHVPPPLTEDDRAEDGFDQLGVRTPTMILGPWARQGVDPTVYDHSSWIRFICDRYGIEPWNARLRAATGIDAAIDWDRMERGEPTPPISLPAFDFDPDSVADECFTSRVAHLEKLAGILAARGILIPLGRPELTRSPFIREWRKKGLIG